MQKSVSDQLYIPLTKPGRGVIQFETSSFQKASQRGKYSYLEKSPKRICSFYNYLLSTFHSPCAVLKHNAVRWTLLHLHLADEETEEKLPKVMQQGNADPGFEPGVRWQRAGFAPRMCHQSRTEMLSCVSYPMLDTREQNLHDSPLAPQNKGQPHMHGP